MCIVYTLHNRIISCSFQLVLFILAFIASLASPRTQSFAIFIFRCSIVDIVVVLVIVVIVVVVAVLFKKIN